MLLSMWQMESHLNEVMADVMPLWLMEWPHCKMADDIAIVADRMATL